MSEVGPEPVEVAAVLHEPRSGGVAAVVEPEADEARRGARPDPLAAREAAETEDALRGSRKGGDGTGGGRAKRHDSTLAGFGDLRSKVDGAVAEVGPEEREQFPFPEAGLEGDNDHLLEG